MAYNRTKTKTKRFATNARNKVDTNPYAPKGSWLDSNGKRWMKVLFDVMADGGTRFVRQVSVTLGIHFDFGIGGYMLDLLLDDRLTREIIRQHPSLGGVRNPVFLPTTKKIFR